MLMLGMCFLGLVAGSARGEPYWIAYEGDVFPEEEGWWHIWEGAAERSLEDGVLVIDSLHDIAIADFYQMHMYGELDPEPGELFVMEWRLRIDEMIGSMDVGVGAHSDARWGVAFSFGTTGVYSVFECETIATVVPGVFHEYELRSWDMRTYEFLIDGTCVKTGAFVNQLGESHVAWGDTTQGEASRSCWDYLRFGVVPEPGCALLAFVLLPVILGYRECWR
jgi:hypothetical protein